MTTTDNPPAVSESFAELEASVAIYRQKEADCPANKRCLGDQLCPKCGANSNEPCRETVRAAYAVTDAAKGLLKVRGDA